MSIETWKNYKEKKHSNPSPLRGIRVLELCTVLLGPAGPGFLGAMGAEVIKCELPPMGDTCRNLVPFGCLFKEQGQLCSSKLQKLPSIGNYPKSFPLS